MDKQKNNKNKKAEMGRKTIIWILQMTNWGGCM